MSPSRRSRYKGRGSFFRPAEVRRLPTICLSLALCFGPADFAWPGWPAFLISAYLSFMPSEIFLLAAALILLFFDGAVGLRAGTVCAVVDWGFSWDLICRTSPSLLARLQVPSMPVRAVLFYPAILPPSNVKAKF